MKRILFIILLTTALASCTESKKNTECIDEKVDDIITKMTLEEKIGQMVQLTSRWEMTGPAPAGEHMQGQLQAIKNGEVGSMLNVTGAEACFEAQKLAVENSRLKIPMIFGYDVIHGYQTMFPIPLAMSASWDTAVIRLASKIAAREASSAGLNWTFGPMVDISRDARWGRVMEGSGEDPYLGSVLAKAYIEGYQGNTLSSHESIAACAKHFAAYGFAIAGRDYNSVDISNNTLFNVVLPPFKACSDAGAATFMNSFNDLNGIPATANSFLLRDILKEKWGFKGFVVSDWGSIRELIDHGNAADKKEAALKAVIAGSDMDMEGDCYASSLKELVESGTLSETIIDDAVERILRVKFQLGLFDDPYKYCDTTREKAELLKAENLAASRDIARKSIVLLKNKDNLLPLKKSGQSIAVIGPLANDKDSPLGSWRAQAIRNSAVSLLEGVKAAVEDSSKITYALGANLTIGESRFHKMLQFNETDKSGFAEAITAAKNADVVLLAIGENCFQTAEGRSQVDIGLKGVQIELFRELYRANKNIVIVLMNGRPLVLNELDEKAPAILETWHLGSESGNAIADVLFGDYNPAGKLSMSFPRAVGQCPIYYNHLNTGRPSNTWGGVFWSHYTDEENSPLYPFGYGLSYTNFDYSPIKMSAKTMSANGTIKASIDVKNTGNLDGEEIVQLYIQDVTASIVQPVRLLKAFNKIFLKAGETKTVEFTLSAKDLSFYSNDYKLILEPGTFNVFIGTNARDTQTSSFTVE